MLYVGVVAAESGWFKPAVAMGILDAEAGEEWLW
jgi:hypothetical protein